MTWRVAESLEVLRRQINDLAPKRSTLSDGGIGDAAHAARTSDHNPWVKDGSMGVVTARDFTHDPAGGCDCQKLAEALVAHGDARIKYVIWNRHIWNPSVSPAWRPYNGSNPHTKHLHLSVKAAKDMYDSRTPWNLDGFTGLGVTPKPDTPIPDEPINDVPPLKYVVRRGAQGAIVGTIQTLLNGFGFDAGQVDGIFGSRTGEAVRAFQRDRKLDVDEVVGPYTWEALNS